MHRQRLGMRGVIVALAVPAMLLAACSDDDSAVDANRYTPELRASFVDSCSAQGESKRLCGCFYDSLAVSVPFERFKKLDARIRDGSDKIPADIVDLAAACDARFATSTTTG